MALRWGVKLRHRSTSGPNGEASEIPGEASEIPSLRHSFYHGGLMGFNRNS